MSSRAARIMRPDARVHRQLASSWPVSVSTNDAPVRECSAFVLEADADRAQFFAAQGDNRRPMRGSAESSTKGNCSMSSSFSDFIRR